MTFSRLQLHRQRRRVGTDPGIHRIGFSRQFQDEIPCRRMFVCRRFGIIHEEDLQRLSIQQTHRGCRGDGIEFDERTKWRKALLLKRIRNDVTPEVRGRRNLMQAAIGMEQSRILGIRHHFRHGGTDRRQGVTVSVIDRNESLIPIRGDQQFRVVGTAPDRRRQHRLQRHIAGTRIQIVALQRTGEQGDQISRPLSISPVAVENAVHAFSEFADRQIRVRCHVGPAAFFQQQKRRHPGSGKHAQLIAGENIIIFPHIVLNRPQTAFGNSPEQKFLPRPVQRLMAELHGEYQSRYGVGVFKRNVSPSRSRHGGLNADAPVRNKGECQCPLYAGPEQSFIPGQNAEPDRHIRPVKIFPGIPVADESPVVRYTGPDRIFSGRHLRPFPDFTLQTLFCRSGSGNAAA